MRWLKRLASRFRHPRTWRERSSWKTSDVYTGGPQGSQAPFDRFGSGGAPLRERRTPYG